MPPPAQLWEETSWTALGVTVFGYLLTLLLIRWVLLTRKENPGATVAWIMAIVFVPIFGALLFLMFGVNRVDRRLAMRQESDREFKQTLPVITVDRVFAAESSQEIDRTLMTVATNVGRYPATNGNSAQILSDTNQALGLIEQAIHRAEKSIHLQFYMWKQDATGTRVRDLLVEKAKQGVTVRFLYDALGSSFPGREFFRPMRSAGIRVASTAPGSGLFGHWSINLRNHRKIVICDGKVGFTGGMNIGDEYLGITEKRGYWRDTHLRLEGPVVSHLQQIFAEDWYYATEEALSDRQYYPEPSGNGTDTVQMLSGQPTNEANAIRTVMFAAINEARSRILITTGYFVPPFAIVRSLEAAAYRGVRVALMVPGTSTYFYTMWAGRSYYDSLLEAGVEIYEYQRGALHAKTMTVDGQYSIVGSANLDNRSLLLNFEASVAIFDDRQAEQLDRDFKSDIKNAKRIDLAEWTKRSKTRVMGENVCRMFSPIL
ncbi:cardiolipin synthase [Stratiformator vulcanicus]|uniref:cardiolipin synthase n=1 Tax=Stratiformator vulcanicus TaxID=2527980 RepID=UPI002877ED1B|nr:cardiolipin synthase [Stratiformator vulcanicus]